MPDDLKEEKKRNKRLRLLDKQRKMRIDEALKALMKHSQGRDYLYWLLELSQMYHNPFTANALTTAFNCGSMNVGQQILDHILEVDPDGYLRMLRDKERERLDASRSSTDPDANPDSYPKSDAEPNSDPDS